MANTDRKPIRPNDALVNAIRERGFKILLIDDDDRFRRSLSYMLRLKYNAEVEDVSSGASGIEKLREGHSYDFIFVDIMMPGMTGIETYYELRKLDANVKIMIMSAYHGSRGWQEAEGLKDVSLAHKPISEDELNEVLAG